MPPEDKKGVALIFLLQNELILLVGKKVHQEGVIMLILLLLNSFLRSVVALEYRQGNDNNDFNPAVFPQ